MPTHLPGLSKPIKPNSARQETLPGYYNNLLNDFTYGKPLIRSAHFLITSLAPKDIEEATECILHTFLKGEPMCSLLDLSEKGFGLFTRLYVEKAAKGGLSLIARHTITHAFMDCVISEDMSTTPPEGIEQISEKILSIVFLLEELDRNFLDKNLPIPGHFFHMFLCGVYEKFSGLQLTKSLTQASEQLAKGKGYKMALLEATGPASQHIIKNKLGYTQQAALSYKSFYYQNNYPFASIKDCQDCLLLNKEL